MARYRATINGKEVVAEVDPRYDGFGYTPYVTMPPETMDLKLGHTGGLPKKVAFNCACDWLESLGFTRIEDDND